MSRNPSVDSSHSHMSKKGGTTSAGVMNAPGATGETTATTSTAAKPSTPLIPRGQRESRKVRPVRPRLDFRMPGHDISSSQPGIPSPLRTHPNSAYASPVSENENPLERGGRQANGRPSRSPKERSLSRKMGVWHPQLELENVGSVARDHLASERTFLAYLRTSLGITSTGVALVQLFTIAANRNSASGGITPAGSNISSPIQRFARPLGATTVLLGLIVLFIGAWRFFAVQRALTQGVFPVARGVITFISSSLSLVVVIVFAVLVGVKR